MSRRGRLWRFRGRFFFLVILDFIFETFENFEIFETQNFEILYITCRAHEEKREVLRREHENHILQVERMERAITMAHR